MLFDVDIVELNIPHRHVVGMRLILTWDYDFRMLKHCLITLSISTTWRRLYMLGSIK